MKQILIVEDDIALNSGLCRALNGDDRHIVSCNTLRDAREQIMISKPTLVLLDINLPDGIGFDLLKEIKSQDANIAVILLTANDTDMDIVEIKDVNKTYPAFSLKNVSFCSSPNPISPQNSFSSLTSSETVKSSDFKSLEYFVKNFQ